MAYGSLSLLLKTKVSGGKLALVSNKWLRECGKMLIQAFKYVNLNIFCKPAILVQMSTFDISMCQVKSKVLDFLDFFPLLQDLQDAKYCAFCKVKSFINALSPTNTGDGRFFVFLSYRKRGNVVPHSLIPRPRPLWSSNGGRADAYTHTHRLSISEFTIHGQSEVPPSTRRMRSAFSRVFLLFCVYRVTSNWVRENSLIITIPKWLRIYGGANTSTAASVYSRTVNRLCLR